MHTPPSLDFGPSSKHEQTNPQPEPTPPHEALFLVLAYLPVFDLLNMSEVCASFRDTVNKDVLPWLNIIIDKPLNLRLSDEILMKITSKAKQILRSLVLRNCIKITDDGLQRVVEKNTCISKLQLPGCTGLTPEGIIRAVQTLSHYPNSLTSLQINGIYNLKKHHLEILSSYLKTSPSTSTEGDRILDVDICPKCNEVQMVYDCFRERCRLKRGLLIADCRGCKFCVPRCEECGGCVDAEEQEDAACADILCSDCWLRLPKCNYCNKPYCKLHACRQFSFPDCTGFICEACHTLPRDTEL